MEVKLQIPSFDSLSPCLDPLALIWLKHSLYVEKNTPAALKLKFATENVCLDSNS